MLSHVRNQLNTWGFSLKNTWQDTETKKEEIITDKLIITRKSLCNLSQFKQFAKFNVWISTLKNKKTTCADTRLMNSQSVSPLCLSECLQSVSGQWRSLKKELWLVPLNNGSLGAGKRGPGTNVAIMLMVRITGDGHYWPYIGLLCSADCSAATASIVETQRLAHHDWLGWWAMGDRQEEASAQL